MSKPEEHDSTEDSDINVPPIKLPTPDRFDTSKGDSSTKLGKKTRKQKKKKSKHPLDLHNNKKPRGNGAGGCCGAIGCFVLLIILVLVGGIGIPAYTLFKDFGDGYKVVQLEGLEEVISVAPNEPTLYVNPQGKIIYNAPQTAVRIGLVAQQVEVSGQFAGKLLIRGSKVTCKSNTHCLSDLNVYAVRFIDEGARVDGVKEGKTLQ